ncbi:MAG: hypothetical protein K2K63_07015 [Acetatifactor sp.]|nr:hypothetical protein [Acetatifactor sp.]
MNKEKELYLQIEEATQNGNDAEVRRDREGRFVVYSVKKRKQKQRTDK